MVFAVKLAGSASGCKYFNRTDFHYNIFFPYLLLIVVQFKSDSFTAYNQQPHYVIKRKLDYRI